MEIGETAKDGNNHNIRAKRNDIRGEAEGFGSTYTGAEKKERGDMIQVHKLMNGMNVVDNKEWLLRHEITNKSIRPCSHEVILVAAESLRLTFLKFVFHLFI